MATNIKKTSVSGRVPNTFTLSADGDIGINTHDGKLWVSNGSVVFEIGAGGGGLGVPGGLNTQIQFNDSNQFAGDAGLTYNKTTDALTIAGLLYVGANVIANTSALFIGNSSVNSVITSSSASLGNTTITGFANVSSTLAAGNTTITGFANVSSTLAAGNTTITGFANVSVDAKIHAYTVGRGNSAHITNLAFGYNALANSATYADGVDPYSGRWNVGIGYQTLLNNTDGYDNIAVGHRALAENTTAYDNIAIGESALSNNVTGDSNIAIGTWAQVDAKGYQNIAIGHYTMGYANNAIHNIGVGYGILNSLNDGSYNIALGDNSSYFLGDGNFNIGIGSRSNYRTTTGNNNIGFGQRATHNNTTGSNNIGIGYYALYGNENSPYSSASYNIGIGAKTLYSVTTGNVNIGIGVSSLERNTTGRTNIALGDGAMNYNVTGSYNFAAGETALRGVTSTSANGWYNIGIGLSTMQQINQGNNNIAFGTYTLQGVANGSYNIALGFEASQQNYATDTIAIGRGSQKFGGSGNNNIGIGANSLHTVGIANGSNNIAIGHRSGINITGSNNLLLGAVLGNSSINDTIIVGTGGGTERFRVDSGGNVAIGTITASNRLQVNGSVGISNTCYVSKIEPFGFGGVIVRTGSSNNADYGFGNPDAFGDSVFQIPSRVTIKPNNIDAFENVTLQSNRNLTLKVNNAGGGATPTTTFMQLNAYYTEIIVDTASTTGATKTWRFSTSGIRFPDNTVQTTASRLTNSGTATLVGGTVTVSTSDVTSTSRIFLTIQSLGTVTVPKSIAVTSRVNNTSFTITSEDNTDTSVIAWMLVQA